MLWRFLILLTLGLAVGDEDVSIEDECWSPNETCSVSLRQLRGDALSTLDVDSLNWENYEEEEDTFEETNETAGPYTFYVYRAKNDHNYEDTNVNMANLAGVLWYLHSEVVGHCPRKFGITRILRYKITMMPTKELLQTKKVFAPLCHFDSGACTGPKPVLDDYQKFGYVVGCDRPSFSHAAYSQATWYSFPGACPSKTFQQKQGCAEAGGECKAGEAWSRTCTWRKQFAGEITLDQLTHNFHFEDRCKKGFEEYNIAADRGQGTNYWHTRSSKRVCDRRMSWAKRVFASRCGGPRLPEAPECPYGDAKR